MRKDLSELKGRKYQGKRNQIKQFKEKYDYSVSPLSESDFEECLEFYHKWVKNTLEKKAFNSDYEKFIKYEETVVRFTFQHFNELGQLGIVVRVGARIIAFTFGAASSNEVFDVQIEKANTSFKGIYAFINQQFASRIPHDFVFLDREDDLGIEGLRVAKMQYHPESIIPYYRFENISDIKE